MVVPSSAQLSALLLKADPASAKHSFVPPHSHAAAAMLGLNPHMGAAHPFQSMLPGLHHAAAAAAALGPPGPHHAPPSAAVLPPSMATGPMASPHHPLHNVPINMWPLIWNHLSK
jgi:hypothetical protein